MRELPAHLLEKLSVYGDRWGSANGLPLTGKFRLIAKGISIEAGWVCSLKGRLGRQLGYLTQGPHIPEVAMLNQG